MKYLLSWITEFFPSGKKIPSAGEIVQALNQLGLSVAQVKELKNDFTGVVVGEVLSVRKHPNADRLVLTTVTDGTRSYSVVCGAPNVSGGQRVALARAGARLNIAGKGPIEIQKTKIRNVESQGMLCSSYELGLDNDSQGIAVLPADWPLGKDLKEFYPEDALFDVELPFHRWDVAGHKGLARELAIYFWRLPIKEPKLSLPKKLINRNAGAIKLEIESQSRSACRRYIGCHLVGVKPGPSPRPLTQTLKILGLKSINSIVDITNYIMLETGQPLHAFDSRTINGNKILVRWAAAGEKLLALDGRSYDLNTKSLVIADAAQPIALAGIIGGENTKITEQTTEIYLECAWFSRQAVRPTSLRLDLKTESSQLFAKETDITALPQVVARSLELITKLAGGQLAGVVDFYPKQSKIPDIRFNAKQIDNILGFPTDEKTLIRLLTPLATKVKRLSKGNYSLTPRSWRMDLGLTEDLAEEVLRYRGYDCLPDSSVHQARIPTNYEQPNDYALQKRKMGLSSSLAQHFRGLGFSEVVNFPLINPQFIALHFNEAMLDYCLELENPHSSEFSILRPTHLAGMLANLYKNLNHGRRAIRLQEIGYNHTKGPSGAVLSKLTLGLLAFGPFWPQAHWLQNQTQRLFTPWDLLGLIESLARDQGWPLRRETFKQNWRIVDYQNAHAFYLGETCLGWAAQLKLKELPRDGETWPVCFAEIDIDALTQYTNTQSGKIYKPITASSAVERDMAIVVDEPVPWSQIELVARETLGDKLGAVWPFDIYQSENLGVGKKSIAFRFTLANPQRSLRQEDINVMMDSLADKLKNRLGALLRQ